MVEEPRPIEPQILDTLQTKWPQFRLHVENLPWLDKHSNGHLETIPYSNIVSLHVESLARSRNLTSLRAVLFPSPSSQLKTLHITGFLSRFSQKDEEKLPPFEDLILNDYDWRHNQTQTFLLWEWSNLVNLELKRVNMEAFLLSNLRAQFPRLRIFRTDGHCGYAKRNETSRLLLDFVTRLPILEELYVTCVISASLVPTLSKIGSNLRSLEIREYTGLDDVDIRLPSLPILDLPQLERSFPRLMSLGLEMDYQNDIIVSI